MMSNVRILILSLLMTPLAGMGMDLCVPSLPHIQTAFNVPNSLVALAIPVFLLGLALQPICGVWVDQYGRRKIIVIGLALLSLFSVLAAFASNVGLLLLWRFFQGLTVSTASVVSKAILIDTREGQDLRTSLNYVTIAWSLGFIASPLIGGYLQYYVGWQANFYFLAVYAGVLSVVCYGVMPETLKHPQTYTIKKIISTHLAILTHPVFYKSIICLITLFSLITVFHVQAPFLIQDILHFNPAQYGQFSLLLGCAWFVGNTFNSFISRYSRPYHVVKMCLAINILFASIMVLFALFSTMTIYSILIPSIMMLLVGSIAYPNIFANILTAFPGKAGTVSGLQGAALVGGGGITSMIISFIHTHSLLPLALSFLLLMLISLIVHTAKSPLR